jgi:enoyl-CoA hydratase
MANDTDDVVLLDVNEGVATITLNRPDKRNAMNAALRNALTAAFLEAERREDVDVVILTGAGKAFCAGLDLKELGGEVRSDQSLTSAVTSGALLEAILAMKKPVIGAINGMAVTGGFELALACDLLIASSEAQFADTHARVGILPGWGLSQKLARVIGIYRAKELSLTGNYLGAEQAERFGLVSRVVAPEQLLPTCRGLAEDMRSADATSLRAYKRVIDDGYARDLATGLAIEQEACRAHAQKVDPAQVAARRAAIAARGRSQSGG